MGIKKIIGIFVLIFGVLTISALYKDYLPFLTENKPEIIRALWKQDLERLIAYKKIPKQWTQIKEIEYIPLSPQAKNILEQVKPPIAKKENGMYRLEISMDEWREHQKQSLMIQYNLVDLESGNTIWELGRTLIINP